MVASRSGRYLVPLGWVDVGTRSQRWTNLTSAGAGLNYRPTTGLAAVTVLDRQRLEARVCECYAVVKREYDRLLPPGPAT